MPHPHDEAEQSRSQRLFMRARDVSESRFGNGNRQSTFNRWSGRIHALTGLRLGSLFEPSSRDNAAPETPRSEGMSVNNEEGVPQSSQPTSVQPSSGNGCQEQQGSHQ
ncbi:hypothetical protein FRC02_001212 [Tulasnella sp. 418]|nr:hypothetical protein FRC02_001212 [Tulasnella sp. 418]